MSYKWNEIEGEIVVIITITSMERKSWQGNNNNGKTNNHRKKNITRKKDIIIEEMQ